MPHPSFRSLLVFALACLAFACADPAPPGRGLVVTNPTDANRPLFHDFDVVPVGEIREHTYVLENTDPKAITVHKLQPSCGCTVPRVVAIGPDGTRTEGRTHYSDGGDVVVVPEDGTLELTVITDTDHVRVKNQHKLNFVRLTCDSENEPYLAFEQHIWVRQAFNATPEVLDLKLVPEGGGKAASIELFPAAQESAARVTGVHSAPDGMHVEFAEEHRTLGTVTVVTAELQPGLPRGPFLEEVWLETTADDGETPGPPFRLEVRAQVTTDVVCSPASLIFNQFDPAQGATQDALVQALIPGERVMITGHEWIGDAEGLSVTYEPDAPGADGRSVRWRVTVTAAPELAGKSVRGNLVFHTDIESVAKLRVPYTGNF